MLKIFITLNEYKLRYTNLKITFKSQFILTFFDNIYDYLTI